MESDDESARNNNNDVCEDGEELAVELLCFKFAKEEEKDDCDTVPMQYSWDSDAENGSVVTYNTNTSSILSKKKANKSMSSQTLLTCVSQVKYAISLIENSVKPSNCKKNAKITQTTKQRHDFKIALKALHKVRDEMDCSAKSKSNTYEKEINKRKKVDDEDNYIAKHGLRWNDNAINSKQQDLINHCRAIKQYIAKPSFSNERKEYPSERRSDRLKSSVVHNVAKVKKGNILISFPLPRLGDCYFPQEMCEIFLNTIQPEHMYFILKK